MISHTICDEIREILLSAVGTTEGFTDSHITKCMEAFKINEGTALLSSTILNAHHDDNNTPPELTKAYIELLWVIVCCEDTTVIKNSLQNIKTINNLEAVEAWGEKLFTLFEPITPLTITDNMRLSTDINLNFDSQNTIFAKGCSILADSLQQQSLHQAADSYLTSQRGYVDVHGRVHPPANYGARQQYVSESAPSRTYDYPAEEAHVIPPTNYGAHTPAPVPAPVPAYGWYSADIPPPSSYETLFPIASAPSAPYDVLLAGNGTMSYHTESYHTDNSDHK